MSTVSCLDVYGNTHETPVAELQWRPAAYGIVIREEQVLLLRQFGDTYDLPGGAINLGEDPKTAVIREMKEETGINAETHILLGMESSLFRSSHTNNRSYHSLLLYFNCTYVSGEPSTAFLEDFEKQYVDIAEWIPLSRIDSIKISSTVDFRPYIRLALH